MKKKLLGALLCATMVIGLLAGCGAPAAESGSSDTKEKTEAAGIAKEDLKVGFVHVSDPSDMGYTYNQDLCTKEMQEAIGLSDDQIVNKFNVPEGAECDTALR